MDSPPQAPPKSHIRNGTVVSSRTRGSNEFDTRLDERGVDSGRTGRWTMKGERPQNGGGNGRRGGVELVPKPSKEAEDPLVCLNRWNIGRDANFNRTGHAPAVKSHSSPFL